MRAGLVPFLWVCGPSGVGKSSVGWEIFRQLFTEGLTCAYVDFDQIGFLRPAPADDPDNMQMSAHNLATMWPNYRAQGARALIASGIVHTQEQIHSRAQAVPDTAMTVCRLRAGDEQLRHRIQLRGIGGGPPLPGDEVRDRSHEWLARAAEDSIEEADEMDREDLGDLCVDTDGLDVAAVARLVRERVGLWT